MTWLAILGTLSPVQIRVFTRLRGQRVGQDAQGNTYWQGRPIRGRERARRWVLYAGKPEASGVPPEWHGWLHHQTDLVPGPDTARFRQRWQKPHRPNPTGTAAAEFPQGCKAGVYAPWQPGER